MQAWKSRKDAWKLEEIEQEDDCTTLWRKIRESLALVGNRKKGRKQGDNSS